jgi:hypothetical protein
VNLTPFSLLLEPSDWRTKGIGARSIPDLAFGQRIYAAA